MSYIKSKLPAIDEIHKVLESEPPETLGWTLVDNELPISGRLILIYSPRNNGLASSSSGFGGYESYSVNVIDSQFITQVDRGTYWIYVKSLVNEIPGIYNK